ncbi:glycosyltransferase [Winogradskyella aquimaris]|uniref:Glycosyltransferase n=1 Tax=Winogradskyella aquimaris TaxID=864074 RepID=A0ABU5EI83_9FLAO|nr:glycosyltransferase [Winogradskyella aquimaris]MDY2585823.1 glycosyltransferase [Winogradskyella aquimaris]
MITIVFIIVILFYLCLIGSLVFGFDKVEEFKLKDLKPQTKFSIIVPFRNEAANLPELLDSFIKLNYPKTLFEVILVDDDSEDDSMKTIRNVIDTKSFEKDITRTDIITIIKNNRISNSPKKDAITTAMKMAQHDWIVTTDADCVIPKYWLDAFDECIQTNQPNCIVAPVTYSDGSSFLKRFQILDILSLQGAAIGGFGLKIPFLSNGANFAYRKALFQSVDGFTGNNNLASGDDIFLLEKFKKEEPKSVFYLKSDKAIVTTKPMADFKPLIQQRLRWASKTSRNPSWFSKLVGLIVFSGNLACIAVLPVLLLGYITPRIAIALLVIKLSIDFLLLFKTARFFKQESILFSYVWSCLLYPFFSVYIAILSLFKSYQWKGRTFKK